MVVVFTSMYPSQPDRDFYCHSHQQMSFLTIKPFPMAYSFLSKTTLWVSFWWTHLSLPSTIDEWIKKKRKCLVTYIILFKLYSWEYFWVQVTEAQCNEIQIISSVSEWARLMFSIERQLISDVKLWANQLCQGTSKNTAALKSTPWMERYSQGYREMQES